MRSFEGRRDPMRLMWRRLAAIILLLLIALAVRGVWGVFKKSQESAELRQKAEAELSDLKVREGELRADISSLKTDRGIEEELRQRYDLSHSDEGVIVIVDPPAPPPEPRQTTFQKFKNWFSW